MYKATMNIIQTLQERGFIKNHTDLSALEAHLNSGSRTFYIGYDPTGDSMHLGHLIPTMAMAWLQKAGHRPITVLGGGTAMVGDPSGKDKTRDILSPELIAHNRECLRKQFGRFVKVGDPHATEFSSDNSAILVDNGEWLLELNYVQFLREIGSFFSVNKMLSAESARLRLERDQGLSFIEFNYHLLQSYDFLMLNERYGCTMQVGGDDQWFNILGGTELIRRKAKKDAFAFTTPLITTADGKKMGKTEKGAVWLDPEKTSPFEYYQYWVNVGDADVGRFLKLYTFLDMDEIEQLERLTGSDIREAKAVLATEATAIAHGRAEAEKAQAAAKRVFSGGASPDMPTVESALPIPAIELYVASGLAQSKGAARRLIQQGGARFEAERITELDFVISQPGVLWAGKKRAVQVVKKS